ncbi:MAG: hypothetical protein ABIT76_00950 [Chthoniobacterales bacterium]
MFPRLIVLLAALFLVPLLRAQESDPAALALFDSALAKIQARAIPLRKWQYRQTLTTQQFDSDGTVIATGTWKSIFRPDEKDPIEYTSEELDGTLTFFHKGAEKTADKPTKSDQPDSTPTPAADDDDSSSNTRIDSLADAIRKYSLRDRYVWTCLPDEKAAGESAAVIAFNPKPGLPIKTREQRFFAQLTGKIWISRQDATVLKSEGALLEPYRLFWIIARITKLEFNYEVESNPDNRLLRKSRASAETVVVFPFKTVHQQHSLVVDKYEPRTPRK